MSALEISLSAKEETMRMRTENPGIMSLKEFLEQRLREKAEMLAGFISSILLAFQVQSGLRSGLDLLQFSQLPTLLGRRE